jgi:hypothetical protein
VFSNIFGPLSSSETELSSVCRSFAWVHVTLLPFILKQCRFLYLGAYQITVLCISGCIWYVSTVAIYTYTARTSEEHEVKRVTLCMSYDRSVASCGNTVGVSPVSDEAILSLKYEVEIRSSRCKLPADVVKILL